MEQSKAFREEVYLNLMGNTSLCLMKLDKHREASRFLEKMIALGSNKLKFFLRLAVCYETLGEFQRALNVLEKKNNRISLPDSDEKLLRKARHLENSLRVKLRNEESRREELFRKCFNLKASSSVTKGRLTSSRPQVLDLPLG